MSMWQVSNIQPGNTALSFIDRRIVDDNYRGMESSEHNRYDREEIYNTLRILNKYAPNMTLIRIRDTDLSKRPENTPEERNYALFCAEVKKKVGKGTQDSIRKNIFVDLHRMGLIERYDGNKNKMDAFSGGTVKYVALSPDGLKFIKANLEDRAFMFTKALDKLLGGYIEVALDILRDPEYKIDKITKYEFMFFVSAVDVSYSYRLNTTQCVRMIHEYRGLGMAQSRAVVEKLKVELQPAKFSGNKIKKRDWHNWQNKIDQVYSLLAQTPYFDVRGKDHEILTLKTCRVFKNGGEVDIRQRSDSEKKKYFTRHGVGKKDGFELHHVVPLAWAENEEQYNLFDQWINMVYIDAYSHAKITQNRNRNIHMRAVGKDLELKDDANNSVHLKYEAQVLYNTNLQGEMLEYNRQLVEGRVTD